MIICDLEHYEIGFQGNYIEQIKGGLATAAANLDAFAAGPDGAMTEGYINIFAFSFSGINIANSYSYAKAETH